jgi:transposase
MQNKNKRRSGAMPKYTDAFKRQVAMDYLSCTDAPQVVAERWGVASGTIVVKFASWYRSYGDKVEAAPAPLTDEDKGDLKKMAARVKELEALLEKERLRTLGLDTMIEIAEQELGIDIRKKSGTKQSRQ